MKSFQIILIATFAFLNVVNSQQCDSRGEMGLKKCYSELTSDSDVKLNLNDLDSFYEVLINTDNALICKKYNKKSACLGNYEQPCLNVPTFTKVFGISKDDAFEIIFDDFIFQYECKNFYHVSEKDQKCENAIDYDAACPDDNQDCDNINLQSVKAAAECRKNLLIEKCGNKEFAEFRYGSDVYANQKLKQICGL